MSRLSRALALTAFAFAAVLAAAEPRPVPTPTVAAVPSPASAGAVGPALARAPDGTVWLAWLDPLADGAALRCAAFDSTRGRWRDAVTIVSGPAVLATDDAPPALAAGPTGNLTTVWSAAPPGAAAESFLQFSTSADSGRTWSAPAALTAESMSTRHAALITLADGRVLAAWLDHRDRTQAGSSARLSTRILAPTPDREILIAPRVSETSPPALVAFPDGGALLAFRGQAEGDMRDIHTVRFHQDRWAEPRILNPDAWRTPRDPAAGPALAVDGGRVAAAWFTAAEGRPRVLISTSPDAGARFLLPLTLDLGHPAGPPSVALLHDGAALAVWIEGASSAPDAAPAALWFRRTSPDFTLDAPLQLHADTDQPPRGHPRVALLRDFAGDVPTAAVLVAYAVGGAAAGLRTAVVTVSEAALLAAANSDCDCASTPEQLLGYPFRGAVTAVDTARGELTAQHAELPGIFPAGAHVFRAVPALLAALQPGRDFLGRIEQRAGAWWLFNVRLLVTPPARPQ